MSSNNTNNINQIEVILKTDPSKISDENLIFYIKTQSKIQETLDTPTDIQNFVKKINTVYSYQNILYSPTNSQGIQFYYIGLLFPFFYNYPRVYKAGSLSISIATISFLALVMKMNELYTFFIPYALLIYITATVLFYSIFFILFNKLNHISLFFISAVVIFIILQYLFKIYITLPFNFNSKNNYQTEYKESIDHKPYDYLIENAMNEFIKRYPLQIKDPVYLYNMLSQSNIKENKNKNIEFATQSIGNIVFIYILYQLGYFLNTFGYIYTGNDISLFPLIGWEYNNNDSTHPDPYYTCQANYILPQELNVHLLTHEILDGKDMDNDIYQKIYKAYRRISYELLEKYNPIFKHIQYDTENIEKEEIIKYIKDNKIFQRINKILKLNNTSLKFDNYDNIKEIIEEQNIKYEEKLEMMEYLKHIHNTLFVETHINTVREEEYEDLAQTAKDVLLTDEQLKDVKKTIEPLVDQYIDKFRENLNIGSTEHKLFGYHYNIMTYNIFSQKTRLRSNYCFKIILSYLSIFLFISKSLGTPWVISSYIYSYKDALKKYFTPNENKLWKFMTMGIDTTYFEKLQKNNFNIHSGSSIYSYLQIFYKYLMITLMFLFLWIPIIQLFISSTFHLALSPMWMNLLYQVIFLIGIFGNQYTYFQGNSFLTFNIIYFICVIIILIAITVYFMYNISVKITDTKTMGQIQEERE